MRLSFQLYSARNFPPLASLFPKLVGLGYAHVEGYGDLYDDADNLAKTLAFSNISMSSGHFDFAQLRDTAQTIAIARALGINLLICPYIAPEDRPKTTSDWVSLSQTLQNLSKTYARNDLFLAWHNHDFEFSPLESGELPIDLLLQNAPGLGWQFDVAWSVKAGHDPIKWIEKYGARIVSVHVKDIAPAGACKDEDGWADLGQGVLDWESIFAALKHHTDCKSFVMEHDNPSDIIRFATRSMSAFKTLGVAK